MKTNNFHFSSSIQSEFLYSFFSNQANRLFSLTILLFLLITHNSVTAQSIDKTVKGAVTQAEDGEHLAGVHIQLKGTTFGTVTDAGGKFTFPQKLKANDVLIFSFVGLKTQEYTIAESTPEFIGIQMVYEEFTMVGELGDDDVYRATKRPLSRVFSAIKRNN